MASVSCAVADGVATLTLNNPGKRNALDLGMLHELKDHAEALAVDQAAQVVILTGAGTAAFCAGADLDAFGVGGDVIGNVQTMDAALDAAVAALERISVPIVAAVRGTCIGGGVIMALTGDMRVADAGATFGIPAIGLGMAYPLAAIAKLAALCGPGAVAHTFFTGEIFDAALAMQRGLVDEVVASDAFDERVRALTAAMAKHPREALMAYKTVLRGIDRPSIAPEAVAAHRELAERQLFVPKLEAALRRRAQRTA